MWDHSDFLDFYQTFYLKSCSSLAIRKGEKLLDAGAGVGAWTIYASLRVDTAGRVVAVEPNPVSYAKLIINLRLNHISNVYAVEKALWDRGGLDLKSERAGALTRVTGEGSGEVRSETIDSLSNTLGCHFDRIKMDIEGAEARALKGAKDSLTFCRQLILETHGRDNLETVGRILAEQGFTTRLWPAESFTQALREVFFHPTLTLRSEVHNRFRTSLRVVRQLEAGLTSKILNSVKGGRAVSAKSREPSRDDLLALMMGFRWYTLQSSYQHDSRNQADHLERNGHRSHGEERLHTGRKMNESTVYSRIRQPSEGPTDRPGFLIVEGSVLLQHQSIFVATK